METYFKAKALCSSVVQCKYQYICMKRIDKAAWPLQEGGGGGGGGYDEE